MALINEMFKHKSFLYCLSIITIPLDSHPNLNHKVQHKFGEELDKMNNPFFIEEMEDNLRLLQINNRNCLYSVPFVLY